MKRSRLLPVAAAAFAAAVPMAASATAAAPAPAKAKFMSDIKVNGDTATLKVRYRCYVGEHLWISAKQTANGRTTTALRGEGSSQVAATWYQTHREGFVCDGVQQTQTFTIDKVEPGSKG